ncbi:MAG: efflux RND transporter periplasmic adaptor subunit [Acidobacteria bacterium]|nr:efflux RND transporter periplasmic adaptor subunit [Acidobacteriota bacterium]
MRHKSIGLVLLMQLTLLAACSGGEGAGATENLSSRGGGRGPGGWSGSGEVQAVSVRAYRATTEPISTYIVSNTTLESIRKVTVHANLNAMVEEILVEEGTPVREGDVLLRLDDREVRNEYEQADIAVDQAKLQMQQAEVKAELSEINHARAQDLFEQKLISQQEFDQAALINRTDRLGTDTAQQQYEAAAARLRAASIQLDYTRIVASIGGVITQRLVEVGDRVNSNQEVFSLEEFPPLWARIFVPEKDLPELRVGQRAEVAVETFPEEKFLARIKMINPTIDANSGTVKVTLEMQQTERLRPGMFGTVYIATETRPKAVVIPKKAILRERDENRVFVITADNLVEKRDVVLGFSEEDRVEIVEGVQPGEAVITVGYEGLADGYAVNVLSWEGSAPPEQTVPSLAREQVTSSPASTPDTPGPSNARARAGRGGQQTGGGPGGRGGQREMSPEMVDRMMGRLLNDPKIQEEYQARLADDPELATDFDKKRTFAQEMMGRFRNRDVSRRP